MSSRAASYALCLCLLFAVAGVFAGEGYIRRLSNHAGYHLVAVGDSVGEPYVRPRHLVLIVMDGLSRAHAERFAAARLMRSHGQCRVTQVGPISVSRPMYALLSTGLEQDRTGSRNNREASPLAAESIWQVARRSGLTVAAASGEPWWQQLFPDGFDRYEVVREEQNAFERIALADVSLIHPLYVDHAGHQYGAASPEYGAAAARADRELSALLSKLDLERDVVVFTSDHGHTSSGGHGASQPEVSEVLTCFAGRGVRRSKDGGRLDARLVAPALALLGGLRFPSHMRALEDELDVLFEIADRAVLPAGYLAERQAAIARFRAENRRALAGWLGPVAEPSWSSFYARERDAQQRRLALGLFVLGAGLALSLWRRRLTARQAALAALWMSLVVLATAALYLAVRQSLDFSSINTRGEFIAHAGATCALTAAAGAAAHRFIVRREGGWLADQLTLLALAAGAICVHVFAYGWPLGFPLPSDRALFFPFLASVFLAVQAIVAAALCALRTRRRQSA